jgi:hypothetical protein
MLSFDPTKTIPMAGNDGPDVELSLTMSLGEKIAGPHRVA